MKCEAIQIYLSEFIDNELSLDQKANIKEHLNECDQCLHKVETLQRLKQQLVSLDIPVLNVDFNVNLQARINNSKSGFRKLLPLAASIALIMPLVHYLTIKPPVNIHNQFVGELLSIDISTNNDYENFHKWTQIDDSSECLECGNSIPSNHASLGLSYIPKHKT